MAERRNTGIINTSILLAIMLALLISGCRSTHTSQPSTVSLEIVVTPTPVSTVVTVHPTPSPVNSGMAVPLATLTTATYTSRKPTPTVLQAPETKGTASPELFATLDSAWPTPPIIVLPPMAPLDKPDNIVNILLLGNDVDWAQGGRTDSLIIVSLNRETRKVTFLSIPRDLYVVIPGWMMNRINLALPHGHGTNYPGGGGALVKDTILYNLGIPVDYYFRLGFSGFKEMVNSLGGVEIIVNCPIEDWWLRSPDLDPDIEENWEPYLLKPGVHQMDGDLALWYVRSRRNSNDIDRGRRQQKMIRAVLQQAVSIDTLTKFPVLWEGFSEMFETDMGLGDVLELAALAPESGEIKHLLLTGEALRPWTVPHSGEAVQLLDRIGAEPVLRQLMSDTVLHGVKRAPIHVAVETNDPIMYRQVAENLIWYGFEPSFVSRETPDPLLTTIEYRGSNAKGAFAQRLSFVLRHNVEDIVFHEDVNISSSDYHISLGKGHDPCLPYLDTTRLGQIAGKALK